MSIKTEVLGSLPPDISKEVEIEAVRLRIDQNENDTLWVFVSLIVSADNAAKRCAQSVEQLSSLMVAMPHRLEVSLDEVSRRILAANSAQDLSADKRINSIFSETKLAIENGVLEARRKLVDGLAAEVASAARLAIAEQTAQYQTRTKWRDWLSGAMFAAGLIALAYHYF